MQRQCPISRPALQQRCFLPCNRFPRPWNCDQLPASLATETPPAYCMSVFCAPRPLVAMAGYCDVPCDLRRRMSSRTMSDSAF